MSSISNEEFRLKLIDFIDRKVQETDLSKTNIKGLSEFRSILSNPEKYRKEYHSNPGPPNLTGVIDTGEGALQRALINAGEIVIENEGRKDRVQWWDFELPVVMNPNSRRMSIDLVGAVEGTPALCELKYSKKHDSSEHPWYAIVELLVYRYLIHENHEKLDKHSVHHGVKEDFRWGDIVDTPSHYFLIAANKKYWDCWLQNSSKARLDNDFLNEVHELGEVLDANIHLYQTGDEDFKAQQGEGKVRYKPEVTSHVWKKIPYPKNS